MNGSRRSLGLVGRDRVRLAILGLLVILVVAACSGRFSSSRTWRVDATEASGSTVSLDATDESGQVTDVRVEPTDSSIPADGLLHGVEASHAASRATI